LAYYTITATAPAGTAKVRVQSSINCNTMKMDAFCLRVSGTGRGSNMDSPAAIPDIPVAKADETRPDYFAGFSVTVNPNPVSSSFNVAIRSSDNNTTVDLRVLNADDRLLTRQKSRANSILKIDAADWKAGVYFIEVIQGDRRKVIKLIKL